MLVVPLMCCANPGPTRLIPVKPAICQVWKFPADPVITRIEPCEDGTAICLDPATATEIGNWAERVVRWKDNVLSCPYVKEKLDSPILNPAIYNASTQIGQIR